MKGESTMTEQAIKLNLGSGDRPLEGYINLDAKEGFAAFPLADLYYLPGEHYPSGKTICTTGSVIDEIRASHVLEHFPHGQTQEILDHWVSRLRPGGVLKVAVPDFGRIVQLYADPRELPIQGYVMGGQTDEHDFHKALFDEPVLRHLMAGAGLIDIRPWDSEIKDCAALAISLNLMGTKPSEIAVVSLPMRVDDSAFVSGMKNAEAEIDRVDAKARRVIPKIAAVMSVPRLTFTENVACIYRTISELGIRCHAGQGVFWHHALTRGIEDRLAEDVDLILTIDFDSWFLPAHVERLIRLMAENPQADVICAVQCEREGALPILGIHDENGAPRTALPKSLFLPPLTRIHVGHFGLTLFRASWFERMAKPWFREEPDPNGSWREGRRDADVAFWHNFEKSGGHLFLANGVSIGHLQQICTFSGPAAENWKPVHVYLRDLNAGHVPAHCLGKE
jgi:predicted SAM-dependent methyltransferase